MPSFVKLGDITALQRTDAYKKSCSVSHLTSFRGNFDQYNTSAQHQTPQASSLDINIDAVTNSATRNAELFQKILTNLAALFRSLSHCNGRTPSPSS